MSMKDYKVSIQSLIDHIKTAWDVDPWAKEMAEELLNKVRISPSDEVMKGILSLLNLWQDCHPYEMVALVPFYDRYQYEVIKRKSNSCE